MTNQTKDFYLFGDFRLDAQAKILYHLESIVPLKPKVVETLIVLVERAGNVVSKTDLMNAVWQDSFVEENNLSVNIYALRKAFAEFAPEQPFIETVPRRGFRFAAAVERISPDVKIQIEQRGADFAAQTNSAIETTYENESKIEFEPLSNTDFPAKSENKKSPFAANLSGYRVLIVAALVIFALGGGSFYAFNKSLRQNKDAKNTFEIDEKRGTNNIQAYQFYLRGRELWKTRQNPKMEQGIEFFRRAIELDPNFAAAYLGIADSLSMMRNDPEEWRQAEEYALKANALAPDSADVHATLGFILAMNKWDWKSAENEFQRALELDPQSGKAHQWYATVLAIERRFDEAETHLKKAIEIEPLSPNYNGDLCELYYFANRYEDALSQCRRTNEINPDFYYAQSIRGFYILQKRYDEAARDFYVAELRSGASEADVQNRAWYRAYQKNGFEGWMKAEIERYKNYSDVLLGATHLSLAYAQLGDREKALEYLEKAVNGRALMLPFANARPEFDFMRDDARFQSLMRRAGLNQ